MTNLNEDREYVKTLLRYMSEEGKNNLAYCMGQKGDIDRFEEQVEEVINLANSGPDKETVTEMLNGMNCKPIFALYFRDKNGASMPTIVESNYDKIESRFEILDF